MIKLKFHHEGLLVSRKVKKEIKNMLLEKLGTPISDLVKFSIDDSLFAVYSEETSENPVFIFRNVCMVTNYLFGTIKLKRAKKVFYYLIDIDTPLSINNELTIFPLEGKKIAYVLTA